MFASSKSWEAAVEADPGYTPRPFHPHNCEYLYNSGHDSISVVGSNQTKPGEVMLLFC